MKRGGRLDRLSKALLITFKEIDSSKNISHDLLVRGGFVKQSSQGIYTMLPFGLRVLEKLERVIDSELLPISNKISMPCLLSAKDWKRTQRYNTTEIFKVPKIFNEMLFNRIVEIKGSTMIKVGGDYKLTR